MPRSRHLTFELLETFVRVIDNGGRASLTARQLGVNQASMSKRLAQLHNVGPLIRRPWLARTGKRWRLTREGRDLLPAARDLVRRYDRLREALEDAGAGAAARGVRLRPADGERLRLRGGRPDARASAGGPPAHRHAARPGQGARGGQRALDLALLSHGPEAIEAAAGRPLYVEDLFEDPLVLVAARRPAANGRGGSPRCRTSDSALGRRRTSR